MEEGARYPCQDRIVLAVIQIRLNWLARTRYLARVEEEGIDLFSARSPTSAFEDLRGPFEERQETEIVLSFGETFAEWRILIGFAKWLVPWTGCNTANILFLRTTPRASHYLPYPGSSLRQINFDSSPSQRSLIPDRIVISTRIVYAFPVQFAFINADRVFIAYLIQIISIYSEFRIVIVIKLLLPILLFVPSASWIFLDFSRCSSRERSIDSTILLNIIN